MKLCKDCNWVKRDWMFGWEFAKCKNPKSYTFSADLVSGGEHHGYCSIERANYGTLNNCGPEGKYFEPKNSEQQTKKEYERFKLWWK